LEDYLVRIDDMGSSISEIQFMIHVLNNVSMECNLQLALFEKRIGDKDMPFNAEEMRADSSLSFERLNMKSTKNEESEE
jgi:hypothetical protein